MTGDIVKAEPDNLPFVKHFAVIVDENTVIHNTPGRGAVVESLDDFLKTRTVIEVFPSSLNDFEPQDIINKFDSVCSRGYSLTEYNCMSFIDCMTGENVSRRQQEEFLDKAAKWSSVALLIIALFSIIYKTK